MSPAPTTRSAAKRLAESPDPRASAKRPDTRSTTESPTIPITVTQPDDDDDGEVQTKKTGTKEANVDNHEDVETVYSDYPEDERKPAAKPPTINTTMLDAEETAYDDEEGDDTSDDSSAQPNPYDDAILESQAFTMEDTIPDSLNRILVSWILRNGPTSPTDVGKHIEHWSNIARDPTTFQENVRMGVMAGTSSPPIMFLALDKDENTVSVLHHFDNFRDDDKPLQLTAIADDRYNATQAPQTVFLQATDLCTAVEFAIPSATSAANIEKLGATNATLMSPRNKLKKTTPLLLPLHCSWAPLFLLGASTNQPYDVHLALMRLALALYEVNPVAYDLVQTFAWGLITRKSTKKQPAVVAVTIKVPRLSANFIVWRAISMPGVFKSVDLSSEPDPPPSSQHVTRSSDIAALEPPRFNGVNRSSDSEVFEQPPASSKPVNRSSDSAAYEHPSFNRGNRSSASVVFEQPPASSKPVNRPTDSAAYEHPPAPRSAQRTPPSALKTAPPPTPSPISTETTLLLQANQALMSAMTACFAQKGQNQQREPMVEDESTEGDSTARPSKFTARKAAPFHGWASITPDHNFKQLPPLFRDLAEGSTNERHGTVTGFFCHLERDHPQTFAGFQPSDDLVEDISKSKFAPPKGHGTKWHRGVGPMAFADRTLGDIDHQTEIRDLRAEYGQQLSLSITDVKRLESATPLVPLDFEAFLLMLNRYSEFHRAAFGPDCDVYRKTKLVIGNLTRLRQRITRSPGFMPNRAPSIIWALTIATQAFYAEASTASQFDQAKEMETTPPFISFEIDVPDLSKLQVTEACDLPAFLRRSVVPRLPPAGPSPYPKPSPTPGIPKTPGAPPKKTGDRNTTARGATTVNPHFHQAFRTQLNLIPAGDTRDKLSLRLILQKCPDCDYSKIMAKLGTTNGTCLRYHVLGACGILACTKSHDPITFPPGGPDAVCKMLQPGFAAVLARP